ncbi:hypothetical protein QFC22_006631 [Naganishia vaughanmartiniae]|uniref:Uncharacterized protein n=1 Tax=Naganishia vaughanmartiniae TaxID=1424756 RepID=A0ACC2WI62_9TREE|nr:hypothetical protein QFC22_006631 [Naganishia vaughanmartiniae]
MSPSILSINGNKEDDVTPSKRYSVYNQVWDRQYGIWTKAPEPPKALTGGQEAFVAFRRKSANTNNADPFTHIELQDQRLVQFLRKVLPTESGLFNKPASIDAQLLYVSRKRVKEASADPGISDDLLAIIDALLSFVAEEFADV